MFLLQIKSGTTRVSKITNWPCDNLAQTPKNPFILLTHDPFN